MVVESLFCFVFRTSVFQKRGTVARFGREIVVLLCFPDISVAKTLNCRTFWASNRCFALFSGHQCFKNVELSYILGFKSLVCFVFRTSVLQKRRTVAHFRIQI